MNIPFKKDPEEYLQGSLFGTIFDHLPENHNCFVYQDLFEQIDTSSLMKNYSIKGQHAFDPGLLTSILIYAYSQGIFSSRQIHQKLMTDLGFKLIAHCQVPNFRVLSNFRKNNKEFFKECFKQTVLLAMEAGLASLGHVSLDGSKVKANTSKHKANSYNRLKEQDKKLTEEIEFLTKQAQTYDEQEDQEYKDRTGYEIPEDLQYKEKRLKKIKAAKESLERREAELNPGKAIEDKKQISFADHDARIMGKKGQFDYSYNVQVSVDGDHQIIVGQHVSQQATDYKEVKAALKEIKASTGKLPEKMTMDNGYFSGENLQELEAKEVDSYIACGREKTEDHIALEQSDRQIKKTDFDYDEEKDCYVCPQGKLLPLITAKKDGTKIYQATRKDCEQCPYQQRCCQSKKGEARTIRTDSHESLRRAMFDKMQASESQQIYNRRKVIVEPAIGQIKNTGFRQFSVRGSPKVSGEFSLICAVHNFSKIVRAIYKGCVCIQSGKLAPIAP